MNKKANPIYGIRAKLLSAVSMLLVAVIMVISSTYAWFTLSTAPEVKGISTAIGANGALEMALTYSESGNIQKVLDGVVNSNDKTERNKYWGNLVDMSDADYGASQIILLPSKLNATTGADGVTSIPTSTGILSTPAYGTDGRVSGLENNTVTGTYVENSFVENRDYGFRAVGVASGMTDRELAYRNAKATANTYMKQATTIASQSLGTNGQTLANIVVAKATATTEPKYVKADVEALKAICSSLLGSDATKIDGALEYIEQAYVQNILAYVAATDTGVAWNAIKSEADAAKSLDSIIATVEANGATVHADIKAIVAEFNATKTEVVTAKSELDLITKTEGIAWSELSAPLNRLANSEQMKVNGMTTTEIRADMDKFVQKVTADKFQVTVAMTSGAGVYADIADHCGDYQASITIDVVYGGLELKGVTATMKTESTEPVAKLTAVSALIPAFVAGGNDAATKPITEFYGYILDLALRTNAADSKLLLQTAPMDRVYKDNAENNEFTWGGGSTMSFASTTTSFGTDKMVDLMKHINVVFFDTQDGTVYATAKLDTTKAINTGSEIEAPLYLMKPVTTVTTEQDKDADGNLMVDDEGNPVYKTETKMEFVDGADADIKALTQNVETRLSVLVYLDGETITNKDVAAEAAASMTGKLNLQFSSSANLIPMNYGDYMVPAVTTAAND